MRSRLPALGATAAILAAVPASAQELTIDLPAGTVGQQVVALGRMTRINVAVPEAQLWTRSVPRLRGHWTADGALAAIARRAGARAERIGPGSWRLAQAPRSRVTTVARPSRPVQPAPDGATPKDIVVTASKREVTRANYPGQVTRVAGSTLELGGPGGTDRLIERVTSVASTHLGSGRNKLFIRGIADSSFTGPTQATVGQYYGDLRLSYNAPDPDLRLSDLAAVEVLEGPQGTLYGAGSLGGLIRLVPNAPDLTDASAAISAGASATAHGAPGLDGHAVANVPLLADRLGLRLVADVASEGGYIDKPAIGRIDVNRTRIEGGRATLRIAPAPDWTVDVVGLGQRIRSADSQYADRGGPPLTRSAPVVEGATADFAQAQLVVSGSLGEIRVRSTSGVTWHDLMERYDATRPNQPVRLFAQANRTRMWANETRAWQSASDGSGWLAGFSHISSRTRLTRLQGEPGALLPSTGVSNSVDETTLYFDGALRLLPGLLATAGMRASRSVLGGSAEDATVQIMPAFAETTARRTQTTLLPAAAALVDLGSDAQLFMRYQQGFRPGGLTIEGPFVRQFRPDRVATIEAGLRTSPPSGRFDAAFTVAHTAWRDIQADFIDSTGLPSTANVGDGQLWTLEGSLGLRLGGGLRLEGGFSVNDSRIDAASGARAIARAATFGIGPAPAYADVLAAFRRIPNIAQVTARAGFSWRPTLGGTADLLVDGWGRYVGSSRLGIGPVLGQLQGAYLDSAINARLGLGRLGITASVTNLLDTRGNRFALGTPFTTGRDQVTPLRPRTVRVGVDARF